MKYTNEMKINGEMAVRGLSGKAQKFYGETDPMNVYAYDGLYAYNGCMGSAEGLTLEQLERAFEEMYDELNDPTEKAEEIIEDGLFEATVNLMDDDLREEVHADLAPCSDLEFLVEYMKRHEAKFGEEFTV